MVKHLVCLICLSFLPTAVIAADTPKPRVEFRDGDRIAFVGNEFFERDADRGYIETALTTRFPEKNLTFRNLGYSGDTVRADARNLCAGWANFGPADQGFDRLKDLIEHIKPTLVFVGYGMNESFEGQPGLDPFVQGLNRMLDMLAASGARVAIVSPIRHEDLGRPLPDPTEHNKNIRLYIDAMGKVAQQRGYPFVDLFETAETKPAGGVPLTIDGIHLTSFGYWRTAAAFERALGYPPRVWQVDLDAKAGKATSQGTVLKVSELTPAGGKFEAQDAMLPFAPPPEGAPADIGSRQLHITGLAPGRYTLMSEDKTIATASAEDWAKGVSLTTGPAEEQEETLRKLVVSKNFDFFNFWRPDNDTYIFGYRKHEQGRNAVEIPRFEPLVEAKESEIAKLRTPRPQTYVLSVQR
jgi:lysophospholipase L1-like esterase